MRTNSTVSTVPPTCSRPRNNFGDLVAVGRRARAGPQQQGRDRMPLYSSLYDLFSEPQIALYFAVLLWAAAGCARRSERVLPLVAVRCHVENTLRPAGSPEAPLSARACLRLPQAPASHSFVPRLPATSGLFFVTGRGDAQRDVGVYRAVHRRVRGAQPVRRRLQGRARAAALRHQRAAPDVGRRGAARSKCLRRRLCLRRRHGLRLCLRLCCRSRLGRRLFGLCFRCHLSAALSWQRPSSAPAPRQGAPGGSGQRGTPRPRHSRARPGQWVARARRLQATPTRVMFTAFDPPCPQL